jgi:polysaccharide export outer membrane protein
MGFVCMKVPFLFLSLAVAALSASACSSSKFVGREGLETVEQVPLPPPGRADMLLEQRSYLIGPTDRVIIDVYGASELSRTVQVDSTGHISLPLIGEMEVTGKTSADLALLIEEKLRGRFMKDPQVTVQTDQVNQVVTVDGAVEKPGLYPVRGRMTLMRAVASAEGLSEDANPTYVVVFRRVNDKQMAALHDLRSIRKGVYEDPEIFANDVIVVGDAPARRLFRDIIAASGLLTAPLVTLLQ